MQNDFKYVCYVYYQILERFKYVFLFIRNSKWIGYEFIRNKYED